MIGAADTFRAAAVEQLERWGERAGVDVVKGPEGSDPGAVAFDAIARGRERGADVVIIDTAGRLHTQTNLMEELAKVRRVITKQMPDAPHETLMTVDATTGQNGVRQAKLFGEAVDVTGIILTKLDGTAKGGIALAIANELGIPVKLIGIGEQLEDLRPFDADDFATALCSPRNALPAADTIGLGHGLLGALADRRGDPRTRRDRHHGPVPGAVRGRRGGRRAPGRRRRGRDDRVGRVPRRLRHPAGRAAPDRPRAPARTRRMKTGTAALVGQTATVVERIANAEGVGCVKLDGEIWTARAYDDDEVIEPGTRVHVLEIRGATALVSE